MRDGKQLAVSDKVIVHMSVLYCNRTLVYIRVCVRVCECQDKKKAICTRIEANFKVIIGIPDGGKNPGALSLHRTQNQLLEL